MNGGVDHPGWDPYEKEEGTEEDLWFLPGPDLDDEDGPPGAAPLPVANRKALFDPAEWKVAQDALSGDLARLTLVFGELDLRLREAPSGFRQRLALREATDLSWWTGDRLSADQLGLWVALRVGSTDDTELALSRGGWAVRRLMGGPFPAEGFALFLGRAETTAGRATPDPTAAVEFGAAHDLTELLATLGELHPVTQAAILFQAWRIIGVEQTRDLEAAVLAARHGASMSRFPGQGAAFLPLAMTGPGAFTGQGGPERKLAAWIRGAEQACLGALLHLDRLLEWRRRATRESADLSGRVPALLIDALASWPLVSAPLAEAETGASRAAVQRNLDILHARGLVREVTGQGRYRVWTARLPV